MRTPWTCRQEFFQPNKHKPSLIKYIETVVSAGNYFLQSRGLSQKPSQHFIPVWVPEVQCKLHCHLLKVSRRTLCYWGINFVAAELFFKSVTISWRYCFRDKAGRDGYPTLSKDHIPLNEALGCDLESTFCNIFLCSVYFSIFKRHVEIKCFYLSEISIFWHIISQEYLYFTGRRVNSDLLNFYIKKYNRYCIFHMSQSYHLCEPKLYFLVLFTRQVCNSLQEYT